MPAVVHLKRALLSNVLLPGSGLIIAGREWLGFVLAMQFTVCAQGLALGMWVVPQALPGWITVGAGVLAVATWGGAQWLLIRRLAILRDPGRCNQVAMCYKLCDQALREGRHEEALGALDVALTVDDESVETYARRARLFVLLGQYRQARCAWNRVQQLDHQRVFRREMLQTLQRLPQMTNRT